MHFVYSYVAQVNQVELSVFTYYFSDNITHEKCEIYVILKLFPSTNNVGINSHFQNKHYRRTDYSFPNYRLMINVL